MKALTVRQPHASLIALDVKTIETRSWSTKYRGPLAIHAGARKPRSFWARYGTPDPGADSLLVSMADEYRFGSLIDIWESSNGEGDFRYEWCAPLGAVIATCVLADVVPMVATWPTEGSHPAGCLYAGVAYGLTLWRDGDPQGEPIEDQLPYGDFTPGRFALLLEDIEPCEPVPAKGRQGLWNWEPES